MADFPEQSRWDDASDRIHVMELKFTPKTKMSGRKLRVLQIRSIPSSAFRSFGIFGTVSIKIMLHFLRQWTSCTHISSLRSYKIGQRLNQNFRDLLVFLRVGHFPCFLSFCKKYARTFFLEDWKRFPEHFLRHSPKFECFFSLLL